MRFTPACLMVLLAACAHPQASGGEQDTISESGSESGNESGNGSGNGSGSEGLDTAGSETETGEELNCGGFSIAAEYNPPMLMFIVDLSSSMLATWDHDLDPVTAPISRWQTARSLLEQVIPNIDAYELGLQRFPSMNACPAATMDAPNCTNADVCLVDAAPELGVGELHGQTILAALPKGSASGLEIVGGSPVSGAFVAARDHLLGEDPDRYRGIVLISDGGANCGVEGLPEAVEVFDDTLEALVEDAYLNLGIETLVVGVDVSEQPSLPAQPDSPDVDTFAALNAVALGGGYPWSGGAQPRKFFDAGDPGELLSAVEPQGDEETTCVIDLSFTADGPPDPALIPFVRMEIEGVEVPLVLDCDNEDGWAWVVEGEVLSLCGSYCQLSDGTVIDVIYGCGPDGPNPDAPMPSRSR